MSSVTAVSIVVHPDAAARVAELGHQSAFEQMLRQVEAFIPGLHRIEVDLVPDYDEGGDPGVYILGLVDPRVGIGNSGRDEWSRWKLANFPTDVWRHYSLVCTTGELGHAG